jgi:hypothetical protein
MDYQVTAGCHPSYEPRGGKMCVLFSDVESVVPIKKTEQIVVPEGSDILTELEKKIHAEKAAFLAEAMQKIAELQKEAEELKQSLFSGRDSYAKEIDV